MKVCLLVAIAGNQAFAQSQIKITWTGVNKVKISKGEVSVISTMEGYSIESHDMVPHYRIVLEGIETNAIALVNPLYQALNEEEAEVYTPKEVEDNSGIKISNGIAQRQIMTIADIPLLRVNPQTNVIEKLTQFEYSYQAIPGVANLGTDVSSRRITNKFNSVLSDGDIYRIGVPSNGIYKMDYTFLNNLGLDLNDVDPRFLHLYGNAQGMLPQANSAYRISDLAENAIMIVGESDGTFDQTDYILFYGKGPDITYYDSAAAVFRHQKNLYSDTSYYFLKIADSPGKRIPNTGPVGAPETTFLTYDEHIWHERDLVNIIRSGREWYGEEFNFTLTRNFFFSLPGTQPGTLKLVSSVLARSPANTLLTQPAQYSKFTIRLNSDSIGANSIPPVGTPEYGRRGHEGNSIFTKAITGPLSSLNLEFNFTKGASNQAVGNLNYFDLTFKRTLSLYGNQTAFRNVSSTAFSIVRYSLNNVNNPNDLRIWDITDPRNVFNVLFDPIGPTISFDANADTLREFLAFSGTNFPAPRFFNKVTNQNIHNMGTPTMLIVTHPNFISKANELAAWRNQISGIEVAIVTTDQVFNEFSSGGQDISAIRDYAKYLYDNAETGKQLKYLLLFGDCSYDYKYRTPMNNYVPTYQSRNSLHDTDSYNSDDYFGFLDHNEGEWPETSNLSSNLLDIGIGRIPAKNLQEATVMVNKIKSYETLPALDNWRNTITFIADYGDGNAHFNASQVFSNIIETKDSSYNVQKIYTDAFNTVSGPNGITSPEAKAEVNSAVSRGSLIMNYFGHGNPSQLSTRSVIDVQQVNTWTNGNKLSLWITATCEFGRYDDPAKNSGAEVMMLNPNGGAVGVVTTGRPVFASANELINKNFFIAALTYTNNLLPNLGDVMRISKNNSYANTTTGVRTFGYLGDPAMQLAYPKEKMFITEMNGAPITTGVKDTINALSLVTLKGEIRNRQTNTLLNDFNGIASIAVFDKPVETSTKGSGSDSPATFSQLKNKIFNGDVSVINGEFNVSFIVPKDISYANAVGKISMYAKKNNVYLDAHGHSFDIIIGGSRDTTNLDNDPPVVELFMDDEFFVSGGVTGNNTTLIAKFFDDNGINLSRGIGHEISARLATGGSCPQSERTQNTNTYVLNDFYKSELNTYQKGSVNYPVSNLLEGQYSFRVTAWDTHNNSGTNCIEFIVAKDEDIVIKHILNYPNPFSTNTAFHFDHNQRGKDLNVMVQVYTVSGRLVKTLDAFYPASNTRISDLYWNGTDDFGDKLAKGVYIYKLSLKADNKEKYEYQKLVILN